MNDVQINTLVVAENTLLIARLNLNNALGKILEAIDSGAIINTYMQSNVNSAKEAYLNVLDRIACLIVNWSDKDTILVDDYKDAMLSTVDTYPDYFLKSGKHILALNELWADK